MEIYVAFVSDRLVSRLPILIKQCFQEGSPFSLKVDEQRLLGIIQFEAMLSGVSY